LGWNNRNAVQIWTNSCNQNIIGFNFFPCSAWRIANQKRLWLNNFLCIFIDWTFDKAKKPSTVVDVG
jgi:hypothetical protein